MCFLCFLSWVWAFLGGFPGLLGGLWDFGWFVGVPSFSIADRCVGFCDLVLGFGF